MKNKIFCAVLSAVVALGIAGCGSTPVETAAPVESVSTTATETKTIVDVWGREVEIPQEVTKIVCLGSGAPRMAAYLGVMDRLVGVEEHDAEAVNVLRDYNPVYFEDIKDLPVVGAGGGSGANNGYAEQIITVAPDVILAGFSQEAADELQQQTDIPVVSVRYTSQGLANDTFYDAMRVFAKTCGVEERCEEVLTFIDEQKADLNARTENIAEEDKPTVYAGAVTFSGRHGFTGTYSKFGPFDAVHAVNVADQDSENGYYETDMEQILTWDPDYIFLDPGNMNLVEDEVKTNPEAFAAVRAVAEGNVYTMPSFNNCGMNITYALMDAYYAGKVLYPSAFEDVEMEEKGKEILEEMIGKDIYQEMKDGGLYYGSLKIGE